MVNLISCLTFLLQLLQGTRCFCRYRMAVSAHKQNDFIAHLMTLTLEFNGVSVTKDIETVAVFDLDHLE